MKRIVGLLLVASVVVMPACATMEGTAGSGALLGGLAGGVIGHQSGRTIEGALIGALIGGVAGAIIHDVRERRVLNQQQAHERYDYQPSQGLDVRPEGGRVEPMRVPAGEKYEGSFDYAVLGAGSGVSVTERCVLYRGDEVVGTIYDNNVTRDDGVYRKYVTLGAPEDRPGNYRLAHTVTAGNISRTEYAQFEVLPKSAQVPSGSDAPVRLAAAPIR